MTTDKQSMLAYAAEMLNRPDIPWVVSVEGDSIIARWKWMDTTFFSAQEVNDDVREYSFTVTLDDKGKWHELDRTEEKTKDIGMEGGKLHLGGSTQKFAGKMNQKSFSVSIGRNNDTGNIGVNVFKFDTTQVKDEIRGWLEANGWKKAGLFG